MQLSMKKNSSDNFMLLKVFLIVVIQAGLSWGLTRTWNSLEHGDTVTIAVVGSSRADSFSAQWPQLMATAIDNKFPGQIHLDNRGVTGTGTYFIDSSFIACLSQANPPSAIFFEVML